MLRFLSLVFHLLHPLIFISFLLMFSNQLPPLFFLSSVRWILIVLFSFPHIWGNQFLSHFVFLLGDLCSFSSAILYPTASFAPQPFCLKKSDLQFLYSFFLFSMYSFSLLLFFLNRCQIVIVSIPFLSHFFFCFSLP